MSTGIPLSFLVIVPNIYNQSHLLGSYSNSQPMPWYTHTILTHSLLFFPRVLHTIAYVSTAYSLRYTTSMPSTRAQQLLTSSFTKITTTKSCWKVHCTWCTYTHILSSLASPRLPWVHTGTSRPVPLHPQDQIGTFPQKPRMLGIYKHCHLSNAADALGITAID